MSSRTGARGFSPLLEKDEEDEDWVGKGLPDLGQKTTTMKVFPLGAAGGSLFSEGHRTISRNYLFLEGQTRLAMQAHQSKLARYHCVTGPTHRNQASVWELHEWDCMLVS